MKKIFCTAVGLFVSIMIWSADLPGKWEIKFFRCDEKTFLKGLSADDAKQQIMLSEKVVNLDKTAKNSNSAAVRCFIDSEKEQTVWLGVGCKVFSVTLNGKMIYDFRTYGLGNDTEMVNYMDHKIPLELKAGRNELLLNTRRTNWKLDYCYGKDRKTTGF